MVTRSRGRCGCASVIASRKLHSSSRLVHSNRLGFQEWACARALVHVSRTGGIKSLRRLSFLTSPTQGRQLSRGRKAGTIMTQGGSACFEQQAEAPMGCWHGQHNLDGSNRDSLNRAASPVVWQIVAVPTQSYSVTLVILGTPRSVVS